MDNKIIVTYSTVAQAFAMLFSVVTLGLIAFDVLPVRYMGAGMVALTISLTLYTRRQVCILVTSREDAAYRLGRASHEIERHMHSVQ